MQIIFNNWGSAKNFYYAEKILPENNGSDFFRAVTTEAVNRLKNEEKYNRKIQRGFIDTEERERKENLNFLSLLAHNLKELFLKTEAQEKIEKLKTEKRNNIFKAIKHFIVRLEARRCYLEKKLDDKVSNYNPLHIPSDDDLKETDFWLALKSLNKDEKLIEMEMDEALFESFVTISYALKRLKNCDIAHRMEQIADLIKAEKESEKESEFNQDLLDKDNSLKNLKEDADKLYKEDMNRIAKAGIVIPVQRGRHSDSREVTVINTARILAAHYHSKELEKQNKFNIFERIWNHISESIDKVTQLEKKVALLRAELYQLAIIA